MKRKYLSLCICLMLSGIFVNAQPKSYTLLGNMKGITDTYIYMTYIDGSLDSRIMDSAYIQNGSFSFKGKLNNPVQAYFSMDGQFRYRDKVLDLYLVPSKMELTLDYPDFSKNAVLKGSPVQDEAAVLKKVKDPVMERLKPYSEAYDKANMAYINVRKEGKDEKTLEEFKNKATEAKDAMDPFYEELGKIDVDFMNKYPASFVTASLLQYRISEMPVKEGEIRYSKLPENIKKSESGRAIKKELDDLKMGSPGAKAYVFEAKELRGEKLSLADYRGKYVLVDFWASWCVPCRKGNPHLLSLYSKYKDKGFEIIGISDDDSKPEAWQKAVDKDGIDVWKHVLRGLKFDGKNFDRTNDISDHFGIHTLPTKILIDKEGVIIGRYGGGGEDDGAMDKKLMEIFGS